jgi:hypothetical protein
MLLERRMRLRRPSCKGDYEMKTLPLTLKPNAHTARVKWNWRSTAKLISKQLMMNAAP